MVKTIESKKAVRSLILLWPIADMMSWSSRRVTVSLLRLTCSYDHHINPPPRTWRSHVPYRTVPYHTLPYHNVPYHNVPYHIIPYRTIPYLTVSYRTYRTVLLRALYTVTAAASGSCCDRITGSILLPSLWSAQRNRFLYRYVGCKNPLSNWSCNPSNETEKFPERTW